MTDILIKGMEPSKSCEKCFACFELPTESFDYCNILKAMTTRGERRKDCPLVALPPHGDLIDEDEFRLVIYREIRNHKEDEPITMILKGILWEMDNAPVIVEASNGTDN